MEFQKTPTLPPTHPPTHTHTCPPQVKQSIMGHLARLKKHANTSGPTKGLSKGGDEKRTDGGSLTASDTINVTNWSDADNPNIKLDYDTFIEGTPATYVCIYTTRFKNTVYKFI